MGEKFAANPVTGTGSTTVPIAVSPGRSGFGPQLSLAYDSGLGNGPFGFGWSLTIPAVTRKTDRGLPEYRDAAESDVYVLSGAEDLVPVVDDAGRRHVDKDLDPAYVVHRYRPRVEGLFARIERWTRRETGEIHWRSITRDNITSIYGPDRPSRIFDPADPRPDHPTRIFSWLLRRSYDDKGNVIVYEYGAEDDAGVDRTQCNERTRTRTANRYLKRILYGNRTSRLARPDWESDGWLFEVVLDYEEDHLRELPWDPAVPAAEQHHRVQATARPGSRWAMRPDAFSSYRAGFEVRTYRRCRRVLTFHHFDELVDLTDGEPYLVRATEFHYNDLTYGTPVPVEDELVHHGSTRFASFIQSITQSAFVHDPGAAVEEQDGVRYVTYLCKSLPPLEFEYSKAHISEELRELDPIDLENLPVGLDEQGYRWIDLDGEGISGILTQQAGAWLYKPNLGDGHFGPLQVLPAHPNVDMAAGRQQLVDLSGDGQLDVVAFAGPVPGFYERGQREDWETFRPFEQVPAVRWDEPNVRLVDLNGDGHADVLITENEVFTWYRSRGEKGFDPAARVHQPDDEEHGPRLVIADGTQSIYLADMSGDGLSDLVRIRNGEVCYWPSLGYGRFGPRVTMDDAPWFDSPGQFDQQRIRLADIDGSGTNDIIYLHREGVRLYFNQSGNRWSTARALRHLPPVDNVTTVTTADLLGNGTACLVWSSPLPADTRCPVRYVDLMGGQKPHLLVRTANNLGLETEVTYAPSTKYYLADKRAGTPWVTRVPFPVHCVEMVSVTDRWRGTRFSTSYSYHHGYFDGEEREFRGFGRVEQVDTEHYGTFAAGNAGSPYITGDHQLYQPPVKTVTWFHTGAMLDRRRILSQYAHEYFPQSFEDRDPGATNVLGSYRENALPEPDLASEGLTPDEWREALRACKGMTLRQEIYELDVDALVDRVHRPVKIFSAATHNCHIRRLQARAGNRHAVFLVTESEAITYHYELDLRDPDIHPDPRIAHTLNLNVDPYGNVLQSVAVVYPRLGRYVDPDLRADDRNRIDAVQQEMHLAYSENRFTNDVDEAHDYRLPVPCQATTFELTGLRSGADDSYVTLAELRALRLSSRYQTAAGLTEVTELPYHRRPRAAGPHIRLVEQVRTLFFDTDLLTPLAFGSLNGLGLPFESYTLALTDDLLEAVFSPDQLRAARSDLRTPSLSGYASGAALADLFPDAAGQYWIRSGVAGFQTDAPAHFYLPERYTDAFGNTTTLSFDARYALYLESSRDPAGNMTRVRAFDYRILAPRLIQDLNDNLTEAAFDIFGLPAAMAARGKGDGREGDDLRPFYADVTLVQPPAARVAELFTASYREPEFQRLLSTATARHLYWFGETVDPTDGTVTYGTSPAAACSILRETHEADLEPEARTAIQVAFEYTDGGGNALVRKTKAEPAPRSSALRWLTSGKTILNNKYKPVKQYEPYFSSNEQRFEELAEVGVTPLIYYDAVGRVVRTEAPDGTFSRVAFSPWHVATFDANDTVLESPWYVERGAPDPARPLPPGAPPQTRAARLAADHAGTPAVTALDSLGREVVSIVHNRVRDAAGVLRDGKYATFTKLDAEGKPLWIRDARDNLVMQYVSPLKPTRAADERDPNPEAFPAGAVPCYDVSGNLLFQHSMDAGDRWMLMDSTGQPFYAWDVNEVDGGPAREWRIYHTTYDELRRPLEQRLSVDGGGSWRVVERFTYRDPATGSPTPDAAAAALNLGGQVFQHYDPSGLVTNEQFDFKGNLLRVTRRLARDYDAPVIHWPAEPPADSLEPEVFTLRTAYDALGRMVRQENWHLPGRAPAVYTPRYNERGLLAGETLSVQGREVDAIRSIEYDAKGQRTCLRLGNRPGNGTTTRYHYDPQTFRLVQLRTTRPGYDPRFPAHRSGLADENVLQQLSYTYDPVGNITEIYDEAYEPVFFRNQDVRPRSRFVYDAVYRLIEAEGREQRGASGAPPQRPPDAPHVRFPIEIERPDDPNALRNYTQHYTYDRVGNIEQMRHIADRGSWTRSYAYASDSNRLLRTWLGTDVLNAVAYDYDTHGSMLNLGRTPEAYRLRWDYRDMIHRVNLEGGGQGWYNYDAGKQRTRKRIERNGSTVEERFYLGGMEWYRRWVGGSLVEEIETHHLFADDQRVLIVEDVLRTDDADLGTVTLYRYQYGNHLGSVGLELNGNAAVISYEEYHPYGTTAYQANNAAVRSVAKRYRYTGMERDEETGLNYHTARYYVPWLGRWGSSDSIGIKGGMNWYNYASSNPIIFIDKFGRQSQSVDWDLAIANWFDRNGIDDAAAAFGDTITFGGTSWIRRGLDVDQSIDRNSAGYAVGQGAGVGFLGAAAVVLAPAVVSASGTAVATLADATVVPIANALATRTLTVEAIAAAETSFEIIVGLSTEPGEVPDLSPSPAQEMAQTIRQAIRTTRPAARALEEAMPMVDDVVEALPSPGAVAIDTSVMLDVMPAEVSGRGTRSLAELDAALAGRVPVIPQQTYRELTCGSGCFVPPEERIQLIQDFVLRRGGSFEGRVSDALPTALTLRDATTAQRLAQLGLPNLPRVLGEGDSLVAASALQLKVPLLTSDGQMIRTLGAVRRETTVPILEDFRIH